MGEGAATDTWDEVPYANTLNEAHNKTSLQSSSNKLEAPREPGEEWYCRWDPVDNGKAGPLRTRIFWLCALPGLLQFLCGSLFLPALPDIDQEFMPSALEATLTLSIYSLISGIGPILWGPISDRYSRKWVLVGNLFAYGMLNYLNAWSENIWSIIFWRSLIAVPLASFVVVVTGIITDIFREKERAFWLGFRNLPGFMAVLLAPPVGGVMVYLFGWRSTAVTQATLAIVSMVIILFLLPETLYKERAKRISLNPLAPVLIMFRPRIIPNALVQGLGFSAMYLSVSAVPLTFPEYYNVNMIVIGLALVPFAVGSALGAVSGGISTNILKKRLGVSGTLVSSVFWNILCIPAFIGWGYTLKEGGNIWWPIFFTCAIGFVRNATTPPMLMFCLEEVPGQSSAVNAGLLAVQFIFGSIILFIGPPVVANYGFTWGMLMVIISVLEVICFVPILWMTWTTYKNNPPGNKSEALLEEEDPLLPTPVVSRRESRVDQEYRNSSLGYISDSSEFLR